MNFFYLIPFFFISIFHSQNLKVEYSYKPSDIREFNEDVYLNRNYKISIVDSIIAKKTQKYDASDLTIYSNNSERFRRVIIENLDNNTLYYTEQIGDKNFYIKDEIPTIVWNTNFKETKKIGKYLCKKATTIFRGAPITAYYTLEIPVGIGPFKLKGLPGLILEAYSENALNRSYWIAKEITYPYPGKIPYSPKYLKSLRYLTIKEFIGLREKKMNEIEQKIVSKLPADATSTGSEKVRPGIEQVFEWERK